jgi:thiosulfate/3-mercaptopyruvate sulfurtransferase
MLLIEAAQLNNDLESGKDFLLFDCRFDLTNPKAGYESYLDGHIPSAIYVDVDHDLASEKNGQNGRHPLPSIEQWLKTCASLGITKDSNIVIYDNQSCMYAVRMWWMLRATGHNHVQLLNGGYASWLAAGFSKEKTDNLRPDNLKPNTPVTSNTIGAAAYKDALLASDILENLSSKKFVVLDARSADRFRGENETLDPVGGHIPGAINRFFKNNLDANGEFKSPDVLAKEFKDLLGAIPSESIIHQCGSGITACHNMFAMELAGLKSSMIYPGSWSEWCADTERPIEK